jgi:transcriptional regulator with XRE-family HTH domain
MTTADAPYRRRVFCARLKGERERHGTSLEAIADTTKVKASLLEALERGDVSRWPKGIYRRAFFRDYLIAIGLPADPLIGEFLDLFPDGEERPASIPSVSAAPSDSPLRLTLGEGDRPAWAARLGLGAAPSPRVLRRHALAAAFDGGVVAAAAFVVTVLLPVLPWSAAAAVMAIYFSLGTLLLGRSPGAWWVDRQPWIAPAQPRAVEVTAVAPTPAVAHRGLRLPTGAVARSTLTLRTYLNAASRFTSGTNGKLQHDLADVRRRRLDTGGRKGVDEIEAIG